MFSLDANTTAQDYVAWAVTSLACLDDGPEYDRLYDSMQEVAETMMFLEACYSQEPYEKN